MKGSDLLIIEVLPNVFNKMLNGFVILAMTNLKGENNEYIYNTSVCEHISVIN